MSDPLVSVIIPCFNGEAFLKDAIDSALNQTYHNKEIIVVNDGSKDNSDKIIAEYGNKIIAIHQKNQGLPTARNNGISSSKGEFLAFLDSDDYWDPRFIKLLVQKISEEKSIIAYCGWQNIGKEPGMPFVPPDYENKDKLENLLRFSALWPVHAAITRRSVIPNIPFKLEYKSCEDYDFWLRIACFHRISLVPKVLAFYRKHGDSQMTSNQARSGYYNLMVKEKFLKEFREIAEKYNPEVIRQFCFGAYLKRTYRCFWSGDLKASHKMFRYAMKRRIIKKKDIKYALPTIMPYFWYKLLAEWCGIKENNDNRY